MSKELPSQKDDQARVKKARHPATPVGPEQKPIEDATASPRPEAIDEELQDSSEADADTGIPVERSTSKQWKLRPADVTVMAPDELGLSKVAVRCRANTHNAELNIEHSEKIEEFAASIAEEERIEISALSNLGEIILSKIEEATLPHADRAREVLETYLSDLDTAMDGQSDKDAIALAKAAANAAVGNVPLLKSLATLNEQPTGEFESFFTEIEAAGCTAKQITAIRNAVKRVATQTKKLGDKMRPKSPSGLVKYKMTDDGIVADFGGDAGTRLLCNFTAKILEDINEDDGSEVRRLFKMHGHLEGQEFEFSLPANEFSAMDWAMANLGARAVINPVGSNVNHVRAAIQLESTDIVKRRIYTHLGWAKINDEYTYLHAGGAIGEHGAVTGVEVDLRGELARYRLPPPPDDDELKECIRASLSLRNLAPLSVTCCLEGATFRAALGGDCDTSVWLAGQTGNGKSELVARYQQHYGAQFDRMGLPGNWASTGNSLEAAAHAAKDALFAVDDFCPRGTPNDISRYNQTADRLIRALRNKAGRQRLTADGRLRATKTPRCVIASTGEDIPEGHSLRASIMITELSPGDLKFDKLGDFQKLGAEGVFAKTMSGFVKWLACCYDARMKELPQKVVEYRKKAGQSGAHRRTPELVANLMIGVEYFLKFALESQAINEEEHQQLYDDAWKAIGEAAADQEQYQADADLARKFVTLVGSALASGKAHLLSILGGCPQEELALLVGWRQESSGGTSSWRAQGKNIGWVDREEVYLQMEAAYAAANEVGRTQGMISVQPKTLSKRLKDAGLLAAHGKDRNRVLVRKLICKVRYDVLHMKLETLLGDKPKLNFDDSPFYEGDDAEDDTERPEDASGEQIAFDDVSPVKEGQAEEQSTNPPPEVPATKQAEPTITAPKKRLLRKTPSPKTRSVQPPADQEG